MLGIQSGIYNGMSARDLEGAAWRKSQRSNSQGACVEIARIGAETVAMRNSRDPHGAALICQRAADRGPHERPADRGVRRPRLPDAAVSRASGGPGLGILTARRTRSGRPAAGTAAGIPEPERLT